MAEAVMARPPVMRARCTHRLVVLVVEQRARVRADLAEIFAGQPITVVTCDDVARALLAVGRMNPDVVLLGPVAGDRKSTRLNSSHVKISYAVFCLKKKKKNTTH